MSKNIKIAALGIAALATAAAPMMAMAAEGDQVIVDNLSVTVNPTCYFTRNTSAPHTLTADWTTGEKGSYADTEDTLAKAVTTGAGDTVLGTSKFHVVCNNRTSGWGVTATADDLIGTNVTTAKIEHAGAISAEKSVWWAAVTTTDTSLVTPLASGELDATNAYVAKSTGVHYTGTAGVDFTVTYHASVLTDIPADTYEGAVTYTFAQLN